MDHHSKNDCGWHHEQSKERDESLECTVICSKLLNAFTQGRKHPKTN
jgi:hypothetical protein